MKRLVDSIFFGGNTLLSGIIALAVVGSIALGCNCNKSFDLGNISSSSNSSSGTSKDDPADKGKSGDVPSDSVVEGLVKDSTEQFAEAIQSEEFDDLRSSASTDFQNTYSADEMRDAFKSYINKKSLVVPILRKAKDTDADFTTPPSIRTEKGLKVLMANGKFPTKPYAVRFDYEYVMRGGEWKLLKLVVNIP
ncbi:MAG: DUF3887 domain-containing protein [Pyrinomonadaceae bacterium]|nr:DUF3887 domain-containing protein [Pyrinomonadaceae bacterium]